MESILGGQDGKNFGAVIPTLTVSLARLLGEAPQHL
jgi:hypothetical protein